MITFHKNNHLKQKHYKYQFVILVYISYAFFLDCKNLNQVFSINSVKWISGTYMTGDFEYNNNQSNLS